MLKSLVFGRGNTTKRLVFKSLWVRVHFVLQDMWIGLHWKKRGHCLDLWLCLIPCIPIHFTFLWTDPLQ